MFEVWVPTQEVVTLNTQSQVLANFLGIPTVPLRGFQPGPLIKMPSSCGTEGNCRPEKARTLNKTGEKHDHLRPESQSPETKVGA